MKKIVSIIVVVMLSIHLSITTFAEEIALSEIYQQGSAICEYDSEKKILHMAGRNVADTGSAELKTYNFGKKSSKFEWSFEYSPIDASWATDTFLFCSKPANMRFANGAYALQICGSLTANKSKKSQINLTSPDGSIIASAQNVTVSAYKNYQVKIVVTDAKIDIWFNEKEAISENPVISYDLNKELEQGYFQIKSWDGNFAISNMSIKYIDNAIIGEAISPDTSDKSYPFVYFIVFFIPISCLIIIMHRKGSSLK